MPSRTRVSTRLPEPTGTVDLLTTTRKREPSMAAPMLLGGGFQIGQVGFAVGQRRRSDRDEDDVARAHGAGQFRGEIDAAARGGQRQHLLQMRLVDGRFAALQAGDFGRVGIHASHVVSQVGKTRARDRADISGSDYSNFAWQAKGPRTPWC